MYKVEMNFSYGWDDAGWKEDDKPMRFKTRAAALKEITDHRKDCKEAVKEGYLEDVPTKSDFRVVLDTHQ
jgi:hypothetical protein